jgi:predicted RND superfamily exporter protein
LQQIFGELGIGLLAAIGVILLLLTANFQSLKLALVVLSTAPAVLAGSVLMLLITGTTLNLESFMGTIMAIGVAVANAILLVTFAEQNRLRGASAPRRRARCRFAERLRPVLMTSLAMIAGMIPMALAIGQGSEETAPLGRAVIGGLVCRDAATLFLLPMVFGLAQRNASTETRSLDPEDPASKWFEPALGGCAMKGLLFASTVFDGRGCRMQLRTPPDKARGGKRRPQRRRARRRQSAPCLLLPRSCKQRFLSARAALHRMSRWISTRR